MKELLAAVLPRDFQSFVDTSVTKAVRREYRGDRSDVAFNQTLIFAWTEAFEHLRNYDDKTRTKCEKVIEMYEPMVNQYGYSLRNLRHLTPSLHLKGLLLDDGAT